MTISTELVLFIIVGVISVASAMFMLLSTNAVHSALFLILNLTTVAFLYLMLEAPFIALVQIAVYAGAIMVLFLFVIMLLGAERLADDEEPQSESSLFGPLAEGGSNQLFAGLVLTIAFALVAGYAVAQGEVELQPQVAHNPELRVAHAAAGIGAVDILLDGELVAEDVNFADSETAEYFELDAGEHTLTINATGTEDTLLSESLTLANDEVKTAVVLIENDAPTIRLIDDDLSTLEERDNARLSFLNIFTDAEAVSVIDLGANQSLDVDDEGNVTDTVWVENLAQNDLAAPIHVPEGELTTWAIVNADTNDILYRLNREELFTVERNTSDLIVIAAEPEMNGGVRARAIPFTADAEPSFGGPESIGALLFSAYLLPFELVSLLLLVAMVGAILLTQRVSVPVEQRKRDVRRRVSRPLASVVAAQTGQNIFAESADSEAQAPGEEPQTQPAGQ
ncbi:MAG: DUF4397 domain-containing protein [Chloroflexi bacterium]|nr:MAG: DUF4397 domain-containing protein [Chloroflexota bacterium]